jgi:hypothetical protein
MFAVDPMVDALEVRNYGGKSSISRIDRVVLGACGAGGGHQAGRKDAEERFDHVQSPVEILVRRSWVAAAG